MFNNILVVVDSERQGYAPLKYAMTIAGRIEQSRIQLLYAISSSKFTISVSLPPFGTFSPIRVKDSYAYKESVDIAFRKLSEMEEICAKSKIACSGNTIVEERGYFTAQKATFCQLMVCEKKPGKQHRNGRSGEISLPAISRIARVPILAVPRNYKEIKTIQTLYDGSLRSDSLLGFSSKLADVLGISLRVLLIDGAECRAQEMQDKVRTLVFNFFPDSDLDMSQIKNAKEMIREFGKEEETITTVCPTWNASFRRFGLLRNQVAHVFGGPVALSP